MRQFAAHPAALDRPIARAVAGEGVGRALVAASPTIGRGRSLAAFELQHNDAPGKKPDDYRKVNGVVRFSRANSSHPSSAGQVRLKGGQLHTKKRTLCTR